MTIVSGDSQYDRVSEFVTVYERNGIKKGVKKGIEKGIEKERGRARSVLQKLLEQKFGEIPASILDRIEKEKSGDQLEQWILAVIGSSMLDQVFE